MKSLLPALLIGLATPALAQPMPVVQGIFTNEEQVYFDGEAGRTPSPWMGIRIEPATKGALTWHTIDRFGTVLASEAVVAAPGQWRIGDCTLAIGTAPGDAMAFKPESNACTDRAIPPKIDAAGMTLRLPDGGPRCCAVRARSSAGRRSSVRHPSRTVARTGCFRRT